MSATVTAVPSSAALRTRVVRGAFGGLLTSVAATGFLFIGQMLIPRALTQADYAKFTVSISFVALLATFADLGITPMLTREFAKAEVLAKDGVDRRGELLGSAFALRLLLSALVASAVLVIAPHIYATDMVWNMGIVLLSLVISSRMYVVRSVGEAFLRAHGRYALASSFALIDAITFAVILFAVHATSPSVSDILWIYVLCNVPGSILLFVWIVRCFRREGIRFKISRNVTWQLIVAGAPLSIGTALLTIHTQADTLLLDRLSSAIQVSNYAAMIRLSAAVLPIPAVLSGVIAPEITKLLHKGDVQRGRQLVDLSLRVLLIAAAAIGLVLMSGSHDVVRLFLGSKYLPAAPLLSLVGWMLAPIFLATFLTEMTIAEGRFWPTTLYAAFIMVAVVIGDLLLVREYGASGAMYSKLLTLGCGATFFLLILRRSAFLDLRALSIDTVKVGFATIAGVFVALALESYTSIGALQVLASLTVFGVLLALLHVVRIDEIKMVRSEVGGLRSR